LLIWNQSQIANRKSQIAMDCREAASWYRQGDARMSYGPSISLENAKKVAAAALAEVRKNNWTMAVAVVDTNGDLVYFEKMDDTPLGSTIVCQEKARSAARFKRPTKAFQDMLAAGGEGVRVLRIKGAVPVDGGLPIMMAGKVVGGIGLSGGTSAQDGQCAQAGVSAVS
jgi:glc operon protein GlcG